MKSKLKLTDRVWREFLFCDVFEIVDGYYNKKPPKDEKGRLPFLGATQYNNGLTGFTTEHNVKLYDKVGGTTMPDVCRRLYNGGCIAITNNGSVGHAYYQAGVFTCSHDITVVYLKDGDMTKEIALFLIPSIQKAGQAFAYAKKWRPIRMRRSKLLLPTTSNGTPDWAFMEAYMKQVEKELFSEALPKLEQQLLDNIITLGALEDREWKEFLFSDVFTKIQRGKRLKKDDHIKGKVPYVSSTANNNGLDGFVGNTERVRIFSDCITLANSGSVGSAFFQEFAFVASDHVTALKIKGMDKYVYLFMLPIIGRLSEKYGFNREINDTRISREKLLLPVTYDGTPDWGFMSAFMKRVEQETLLPALRHFKSKKCNQMLMGGGKIRPYFMEDVVQIINGVRLTKADMTAGSRPFVGASEGANGVTEFVGNINASLDGNVLGVNYNGSVGFSFYHPYEALFSDDVKRVRWKDETANNKYNLLYLSTAITQQRGKYAYGYKFNAQRMKRQIIMLPSLPDGTPDFAYMEHTMRVMEYDVLSEYLKRVSNE
ncbi:restriction endonuclease subunit S [Porphyromonas sp. COT-290 OH3588]|uniref:restriction endonuclease subunit S n=1 Tax=Porphyromonas sp. COT-290 OH3588 TaxID=1515617 RepID=UPI00052D8F6F|nr:restriction endonuclease subunit S [Porphyromonas sp. COT-290 OH3588]KGN98394.1 hypothetical protein HQ48_07795 [Porphyromonas sp. COT-290 OH3588]